MPPIRLQTQTLYLETLYPQGDGEANVHGVTQGTLNLITQMDIAFPILAHRSLLLFLTCNFLLFQSQTKGIPIYYPAFLTIEEAQPDEADPNCTSAPSNTHSAHPPKSTYKPPGKCPTLNTLCY